MTLSTQIKKLEDDLAAARKGAALLEQVRALVAGPAQLTIPDAPPDRGGDLAAYRKSLHELLDQLGAPPHEDVGARISALAEVCAAADEATHGVMSDVANALTVALRSLNNCDRVSAEAIGWRLPEKAVAVRDAVTGLLEDLESAPRPTAEVEDLERLDAMIADDQGLTWDHSPKDLAMFRRLRTLLGAAPAAKGDDPDPEAGQLCECGHARAEHKAKCDECEECTCEVFEAALGKAPSEAPPTVATDTSPRGGGRADAGAA